MDQKIREVAEDIRTKYGEEQLRRACLMIIERGMLSLPLPEHIICPNRDNILVGKLVEAAGEDSDAMLDVIVELFAETTKPSPEVFVHVDEGGSVDVYANDRGLSVTVIDACTDDMDVRTAAQEAAETLEQRVSAGELFMV